MLAGMSGGFLIVEDEPILARSLSREFRRHRSVEVVHRIADARTLLEERLDWTGLILDLVLPDGYGLELLAEIRPEHPFLPVLVLTGELRPDVINQVQLLRAEYVCKPADQENLRSFIRSALTSESVDDENVGRRVESASRRYALTHRESEILALAAEGLSRREVARQLGVTENTVKAQVRAVLKKSGARTIQGLVQDIIRGQS
jgi:two-component system, NarL family, nitrate/nitrite response regulator NarL